MCSFIFAISLSSRIYNGDTRYAGLSPAPGHTGFDRIKTSEGKTFNSDSYAHYLHHKYFECNYADGILPLDKWFGTFHDGSEEAQERLTHRLKEKTRKATN